MDAALAITSAYASADDVQQQTYCDQYTCDDLKPRFSQLECCRLKEHNQECKQYQDPTNYHEG